MTGFTLIEIMLCLLLISMGAVFFVREEMKQRVSIIESFNSSIALFQAVGLRERLRLNSAGPCLYREILDWNNENAQLLPSGYGEYHQDNDHLNVQIVWKSRLNQELHITLPK